LGSQPAPGFVKGNVEDDDGDDGAHEDEETGEEAFVGRMTVGMDDEVVGETRWWEVVVLGVRVGLASKSSPSPALLTFPNILPHDEEDPDYRGVKESYDN